MRHQKGLYPLFMLVAGFASGVFLSLMFSHHLGTVVRQERMQADSHGCTKLSSCVCDREAEKLKRIARLLLMESQVTLNGSCFKETPRRVSPSNLTELKKFLYPSNPHLYPGVPLGVPKLLRQEYMMKKTVVVGMLTQQEYLATRARAVYETWGKEVSKVVFFVGEDCNISAELSYLPIVRLQGIPDHVYPPLRKAFAVMQYMYDHFLNEFNWFVRADDDMYVRGEKLVNLLKDMNPYERVYLGRAGVGKDDDLDRLHLLPHERYCMGGPGVIFSYAALSSVGPYLTECLHAIFFHDEHSPEKWNDDDVEIGRCISRKLNFQCSTSEESRSLFLTDYSEDSHRPLTLWTKPHLKDIVSIHPVKDPNNIFALHHFYKTLEYERLHDNLFDLRGYLSQLCRNLPDHFFPPSFVSTGCQLKLSQTPSRKGTWLTGPSFLLETNSSSSSSSSNPASKFEFTYWSYFSKDMFYDASSISPRHVFQPTFQAEVDHLVKLLQTQFSRRREWKRYRVAQVVHGYTRFIPTAGQEFILSLKLVGRDNEEDIQFEMVRLQYHFSPAISLATVTSEIRTVNVLLPLIVIDGRLTAFLQNYVEQGISRNDQLALIIVVFSEKDANEAEEVVKSKTKGFPGTVVTIAIAAGEFSFPRAVEIGMSVIKDDSDLVFVAEVNMRMTQEFWPRCQMHTHLRKQVYFPIPFWIYESDRSWKELNETRSYLIDPWTGKWVPYTFKPFCVRKLDYVSVGGYKDARFSTDFFQRVSRSHLEVFHAPDPGLVQYWSPRTCSSIVSAWRRQACKALQLRPTQFSPVEEVDYLTELSRIKPSSFWFPDNGYG